MNTIDTFLKKFVKKRVTLIGFGEMDHGVHADILGNFLAKLDLVNGIFLEFPIDFQNSIDVYLQSRTLNDELKKLMVGAAMEGKLMQKTFKTILDFARKKNIPVICMDSSKTPNRVYKKKAPYGHYFLRTKSRDEDMFFVVSKTLKEKPGVWVIITHAAHLDYSFDMRRDDPSLGKRLKRALSGRFCGICLLACPKVRKTIIFPSEKTRVASFKKVLGKNNCALLFKANKLKGFQAIAVHP